MDDAGRKKMEWKKLLHDESVSHMGRTFTECRIFKCCCTIFSDRRFLWNQQQAKGPSMGRKLKLDE